MEELRQWYWPANALKTDMSTPPPSIAAVWDWRTAIAEPGKIEAMTTGKTAAEPKLHDLFFLTKRVFDSHLLNFSDST